MIPFCGPSRGDKLAYFSGNFYSIGFYAAGDVDSVRSQDADGVGDIGRVQATGNEKLLLRSADQLVGSLPIKSNAAAALLPDYEAVQQQPAVSLNFKRRWAKARPDANGPNQRAVQISAVFGRLIAVQLDVIQLALFGNGVDLIQRLIDKHADFAGARN